MFLEEEPKTDVVPYGSKLPEHIHRQISESKGQTPIKQMTNNPMRRVELLREKRKNFNGHT